MNILKLPMRSKDRAKIVEFYEIFKNTHPSTEDWLELRFRLNLMIKKYTENYKEYSKYSSDELADIKSESQKIKSQITPDFASSVLNVVPKDTLSNTASTATLDNFFCSVKDIPNF